MATKHATLSQIFVYPLKSGAPLSVNQSKVTELGLQFDRHWMIVDDRGQFQTQRQISHLVWIEAIPSADTLTLRAPSQPDLTVPFATAQTSTMQVRIWQDRVPALDMGDACAEWLDNFLQVPGRKFRLVQFDPKHPRLCETVWRENAMQAHHHPFTDSASINLLSLPSLNLLNERLADNGLDPIGIERFRPNLVLDDVAPHAEDDMKTLFIERDGRTLVVDLIRPCTRCQIPEIDPYTAMRESAITDALSEYRRNPVMGEAICFGMQAVVREGTPFTLTPGAVRFS